MNLFKPAQSDKTTEQRKSQTAYRVEDEGQRPLNSEIFIKDIDI